MKAKDIVLTLIALATIIGCGIKLVGTDVPTYTNYLYLAGMVLVPLACGDSILKVIKTLTK